MTVVGRRSAQDVGAQLLVEVRLFHEMLLKGGNRPLFVRKLRENLRAALQGLPVGRVLNRPMMALLPLEDPACWPELRDRLEHLIIHQAVAILLILLVLSLILHLWFY